MAAEEDTLLSLDTALTAANAVLHFLTIAFYRNIGLSASR